MADLIFGAIVLLLILTILGGIGYAIWVVTMRVVRAVGFGSREGTPIDPYAITKTQIRQLHQQGLIDRMTYERVCNAIEYKRLREQSAAGVRRPELVEISSASGSESIAAGAEVGITPPPLPPTARLATPVIPVSEVVQEVREARATHADSDGAAQARQPMPVTPLEPAAAARPVAAATRQSIGELLSVFMRESNIRWGELVGGLMVIGCSIALVVTFWNQIAARPWLQFSLFTAVTASLFGVGLYSEHRWKLPNTSRGLLLAATVLVPLNFLAMVWEGSAPSSISILIAELASAGLFAWLLYLAAGVLAGSVRFALPIGVLGSSLGIVTIARFAPGAAHSASQLQLLGAVPLCCYALAVLWPLGRAHRRETLGAGDAWELLILLGTAAMSAGIALALLATRAGAWEQTLRLISPVLAMSGAPMLAMGLLLWRRRTHSDLAGWRTAGTSTAILGAMLLIGGGMAGWPMPGMVLIAAMINSVVFASVAILFTIPAAQLLSLFCLAIAYVLGICLILPDGHEHRLTWAAEGHSVARAMLSATSGIALAPFVAGALAVAHQLLRRGRREDGRFVLIGAAALAAASVGLMALEQLRQPTAASIALSVCLAQASVFAAMALLAMGKDWQALTRTAVWAGSACSIFAAGAMVLGLSGGHLGLGMAAGMALWMSCVWLALAWVTLNASLFGAFQITAAAAGAIGIGEVALRASWYESTRDLRLIALQGAGLGIIAAGWAMLRRSIRRNQDEGGTSRARLRQLMNLGLGFDQLLPFPLVAMCVAAAAYVAWPGVFAELSPLSHAPAPLWPAHAVLAGCEIWVLVAGCGVGLLAPLWAGGRKWHLIGLVALAFAGCAISASYAEPVRATASAYRWLAAISVLAVGAGVWMRGWVRSACGRVGCSLVDDPDETARALRAVLMLAACSVVALTVYPAMCVIAGQEVAGAAEQSIFARMGRAANYLAPMGLIVGAAVGFGVRERNEGYLLAGGLLVNLAVTLGYALSIAGAPFGSEQLLRLVQFNAIASGVFALGWALWRRLRNETGAGPMLSTHLGIALVALIAVQVHAEGRLVLAPGGGTFLAAGAWPAWLAWGLLGAALFWAMRTRQHTPMGLIFGAVVAAGSLAAAWATRHGGWFGYHMLLASRLMGAWLVLGIGFAASLRGIGNNDAESERPADALAGEIESGPLGRWLGWTNYRDAIAAWAGGLAAIAMALAIRCSYDDPSRPAWAVAGLSGVGMLAVALAVWTRRSAWLYGAAACACLAGNVAWIVSHWPALAGFSELPSLNVLLLAGAGLGALLVELNVLRPLRQEAVGRGLPMHRLAAILCTGGLGVLLGIQLLLDFFGAGFRWDPSLQWGGVSAVLVLWIATLWDERERFAVAGVYLSLMLFFGTAIENFDLREESLVWAMLLVLAGHSLGFAFAYTRRASLVNFAQGLRIPLRESWPAQRPGWLGLMTLIRAVYLILIAAMLVIAQPSPLMRQSSAIAGLVMAISIGLLGLEQGHIRLKRTSLLLVMVAAVLWSWSLVRTGAILDSFVMVMLVCAAGAATYAVGLVKLLKRENEWTRAASWLAPGLGVAAIALLLGILGGEMAMYDPHRYGALGLPLSWAGVLAELSGLIMLAGAAIVCAVVPGRDPLNLPMRLRASYVYAAEVLLVLAAVHLRLSVPRLFSSGLMMQYWPLLMLLLAFGGAGLSEVMRRKGRDVIADPLMNTAAFLPIVPLATFWIIGDIWSEVQHVSYGAVLLMAGGLYGLLAALRRSFGFAVMAALAGNGALWWVLHTSQSLGLLQHPQLWVIPPAVSILAAAYLNRDRLRREQMGVIRYVCLSLIYVSSTADIWLNRSDALPWLPLVLAALSAAGVLLGIAMSIQSFLFMGTGFLLIAIAAMLRQAAIAAGSMWPWLVAGIVVGAGIFTIFVLFEKKRSQMVEAFERLRQWEK